MQLIIPKTSKGKWQGIFSNRYSGDFSYCRNIDLERLPGKLVLSGKMNILVDSDTDAGGISGMFSPRKFLRTNADGTDRWWAVHNGGMLKTTNTSPVTGWVTDTLANSPTSPHDMEIHEIANGEQRLLVTNSTDISILNTDTNVNIWKASWWTDTNFLAQPALSGTFWHPIARLERLTTLADSDSDGISVIHTIDQNDVVVNKRLTFPVGYYVQNIYTSTNRFWYALTSSFGKSGKVAEWNGSAESFTLYDLPFTAPVSGFTKDEIPYFIGENGLIVKFNGSSFTEFAKFPVFDEKLYFDTTPRSIEHGIESYGCTVDGDKVLILVNPPIASRKMRAGIWVLDLSTKELYHSISFSRYKTTDTDVDFGQSFFAAVGGLVNLFSATGQFLAGANVYKNYSGSTKKALFSFNENTGAGTTTLGTNRGYFVTSVFGSRQVKDMWQSVWIAFRKFVTAQNSIVVRHRTDAPRRNKDANDNSVLNSTISWKSSTSFTCTVPTGVIVGDQVEVLAGPNAGCLFTISGLSGTPTGAASLTVTVEETAPLTDTNGTSLARFDNWVKAEEITDTDISVYSFALKGSDTNNQNSTSETNIEIQVELKGIENEITELRAVARDSLLGDN